MILWSIFYSSIIVIYFVVVFRWYLQHRKQRQTQSIESPVSDKMDIVDVEEIKEDAISQPQSLHPKRWPFKLKLWWGNKGADEAEPVEFTEKHEAETETPEIAEHEVPESESEYEYEKEETAEHELEEKAEAPEYETIEDTEEHEEHEVNESEPEELAEVNEASEHEAEVSEAEQEPEEHETEEHETAELEEPEDEIEEPEEAEGQEKEEDNDNEDETADEEEEPIEATEGHLEHTAVHAMHDTHSDHQTHIEHAEISDHATDHLVAHESEPHNEEHAENQSELHDHDKAIQDIFGHFPTHPVSVSGLTETLAANEFASLTWLYKDPIVAANQSAEQNRQRLDQAFLQLKTMAEVHRIEDLGNQLLVEITNDNLLMIHPHGIQANQENNETHQFVSKLVAALNWPTLKPTVAIQAEDIPELQPEMDDEK